ncbi:hypothetical protein V6N13_067786 [Hibiscus sabdariffa]
MDRKHTQQHMVLPIFYHVDPSHVRNIGGRFKTSFEKHESNTPLDDEVKRWKAAFVEVGKLKGWHINGDKSDRPDTQYIEDVVQYVVEKLNCKSRSFSDELIGIDDPKKTILKLIEEENSRVIGLWGMSGIGKTTLADAVYNEISPTFPARYFLGDVREKIEKQGKQSLRNKLLSKLLNMKTRIDTPSLSTFALQRLNNIKVIVVLDDVNDSDQIDYMGVKDFGAGSKIIITSRDRQVLKNGGTDKIHQVEKLTDNDSLQLFSTFAFKLLNPTPDFRDLSNKFLGYAQGNPLALQVLGSKLYAKSREEWEDEVDKLNEYAQPKLVHILRRSFDELDDSEKNIFLDIACFLKGESRNNIEEILSCLYKGVVCGISNLLDKCLLHINSYRRISMHDMLEEMAKDIVRRGSKDPRKYSRLWSTKDVNQVLRYNKVNKSIEGIKLITTRINDLCLLYPSGFINILNLRYLHFRTGLLSEDVKLLESISLPNELRYHFWMFYPFKYLSSNFNPKNLVVLKLQYGYMEQLWNNDHQDLVNLREIDIRFCKKLKKIPNLSRAINLKSFICTGCESLVELPRLNLLTSLKRFEFEGCHKLRKFPQLPNNFSELDLSHTGIEEVPDSIQDHVGLGELMLRYSNVKNVSSNISKLESLGELDLFHCKSLKTLSGLPPCLWWLDADECTSLEKVYFTDHNYNPSRSLRDGDGAPEEENVFISFSNCRSLNQDSIKNIVANVMLQIQSLAQRWARRKGEHMMDSSRKQLSCCFSGNEVSAHEFEHQSVNSCLDLKITPNGCSGSRFLAFAICVVADLTRVNRYLEFICNCQLTAANGEKLTSESRPCYISKEIYRYKGEHVLILFNEDMIIRNNDYEEASFEFHIRNHYIGEETEVEKWGVHVFYVDAESYAITDVMSKTRFDIEEAHGHGHDNSATETRFSYIGGEEANGWSKRFECFQFLNHWAMLLRRCIGVEQIVKEGNRTATGGS